MSGPAGKTVDQYYDSFKGALDKKDPAAVSFANEVGEKYGKLGRKLTRQEWVSLMTTVKDDKGAPVNLQVSDYSADQIQSSLKGLGAIAGEKDNAPPKPETKPKPKNSAKEAGPGEKGVTAMTTPLLNFARPVAEKVGGAMGAASAWLTPGPDHDKAVSFGRGFGKGVADAGIDLTSVLNLATMGAMGKLKYAGRLGQALRAAASGTFSYQMLKDLPEEFSKAKEAWDKGDMEAAGQEFSRAALGLVMGGASLLETRSSFRMARGKTPIPTRPVKAPKPGEERPPAPVTTESRKSTSAAEPGEVERPVERQNPELIEKVRADRGKAGRTTAPPEAVKTPSTPAEIEHEIGRIQDDINRLEGMAKNTPGVSDQIAALEGKIRQLRDIHPETSLRPDLAAKRTIRDLDKAKAEKAASAPPSPAKPSPDVPVTGDQQRAARRAAAAQRAKESDPTSLWRRGYEGLGIRIAPEETGELPTQQAPVDRPIVSSGDKAKPANAPPEPVVPDGTQPGAGSATQQQQYTVNRMPGVPPGSTVIFRESGPNGTVVDIVDPSGRLTPATLPFRDSVANMEAKGWIKAVKRPAATFSTPRSPAEPPTPIREVNDTQHLPKKLVAGLNSSYKAGDLVTNPDGSMWRLTERNPAAGGWYGEPVDQNLPAVRPPQSGPPPVGGLNLLSPEQLAGSVQRANPKLLPEAIMRRMGPLEEASAGVQQPREVLQNAAGQMDAGALKTYIERVQTAFLNQLKGIDADKLAPQQQETVKAAWAQLQKYLEPFTDALKDKSKAGGAKVNGTAPVSNVGPIPDTVRADVENIRVSAIEREGGTPWKQVSIQPVGDDLRTPVGQAVTIEAGKFTPEEVWKILMGAKGAKGIAVSDPDVGPRNGIVRRRLIPDATPPSVVRQ